MQENYDVAIIGGGPVGIFAAYYAGLRNLKIALIDSLENLGGQAATLYPQKRVLDVAGFFGVGGKELIDNLLKQMARFEVDIFLKTTVNDVKKEAENKFLIDFNNKNIQAKSVIIATGNGSFSPRPLEIKGTEKLDNIDYMIKDLKEYKGKEVLVLGGGDSAVDFSNMLESVASKVTLVHRREQFKALERSITELEKSSVEIKTSLEVKSIVQEDKKIKVELSDDSIFTVDKILVAYGFKASSKIIDDWTIQPKKFGARFKTDSRQATSIEGVFAIGDASGYEGKADLIATGFGEAPTAINEAINIFDPERGGPAHSTTLNV